MAETDAEKCDRLGDGLTALEGMRRRLDCTMELLIERPETVDPDAYRFPGRELSKDARPHAWQLIQEGSTGSRYLFDELGLDADSVYDHLERENLPVWRLALRLAEAENPECCGRLRDRECFRVWVLDPLGIRHGQPASWSEAEWQSFSEILRRAENAGAGPPTFAEMLRHAEDGEEQRLVREVRRHAENEDGWLSLREVLRRADKELRDCHLWATRSFGEDPPWTRTAALVPQGESVSDQHADYVGVRRLR